MRRARAAAEWTAIVLGLLLASLWTGGAIVPL